MSLKRRLAVLERRSSGTPSCRTCGGRGWPTIMVGRNETDPGVMTCQCPECGRASPGIKHVILTAPHGAPSGIDLLKQI